MLVTSLFAGVLNMDAVSAHTTTAVASFGEDSFGSPGWPF
jgi:hypothetical protein